MTSGLSRTLTGALAACLLAAGLIACTRESDPPASTSSTASAGKADPQGKAAPPAGTTPAASAAPADYLRAVYDPLHSRPGIETATDQQCLACHAEVLEPSVRPRAPAGVAATEVKAWYQQTSTYQGEQDTFHRRHRETPMAKSLMSLACNTCHQGHDPRDEAPGTSATAPIGGFALRKQVDPETTCLKCHGAMNWSVMGLPEPWAKSGQAFQGNCLICHAAIRTKRHQVSYLKAEAIEEAGKKDPQVCYGCHGGRAWYRIPYPYPRHAWPGMADTVPDWAKDRPTQSEARFLPAVTQARQ